MTMAVMKCKNCASSDTEKAKGNTTALNIALKGCKHDETVRVIN